jgi:hypothetical protein
MLRHFTLIPGFITVGVALAFLRHGIDVLRGVPSRYPWGVGVEAISAWGFYLGMCGWCAFVAVLILKDCYDVTRRRKPSC